MIIIAESTQLPNQIYLGRAEDIDIGHSENKTFLGSYPEQHKSVFQEPV